MNKERMEQLREAINTMICSDNYDPDQLLAKSQELDELIYEAVLKSMYVKDVLGYEFMEEFDAVITKIQLFGKMYNSMRIVDPVKKEVLELKKGTLNKTVCECYKLWDKERACENCISIRASNEDDVLIKMEDFDNEVFIITAVPILIQGKELVVELFKEATDSLYMLSEKAGYENGIIPHVQHMNQAAVKDELTGLYNSRYIEERLPVDLLKSSLNNVPLSIIFVDPDFTEMNNNIYKASEEDRVLRELSHALQNCARSEGDWIARYTDKGFMLCLSNTDNDDASTIANELKDSILKKGLVMGNKQVNITANLKVHTFFEGNQSLTVDNIMGIARGRRDVGNFTIDMV